LYLEAALENRWATADSSISIPTLPCADTVHCADVVLFADAILGAGLFAALDEFVENAVLTAPTGLYEDIFTISPLH
jgi:hypothetical protein